MGLCFSKKKRKPLHGGPGATSKKVIVAVADGKAKKTTQQPKSAAKAAAADDNAARTNAAVVTAGGEEEAKKKRAPKEEALKQLPVVVVPSAPVRTSSCTKEEVDAILIQCGRLSRSSSGTERAASAETGGHHRRRRSASKRGYDLGQERKAAATGEDEECDWERQGVPVSRPSPQRKRSGSREKGGGSGGSRRTSRSPGRRAEGCVSSAATASSGDGERARQQQPGKLVYVPARKKGRAPSPAAAASAIRCASPRSSSPARIAVGNENASRVPVAGPTPALSRSSSRKAEQSPYRRNPMAELDENTLRNNNNYNSKPQKKSTENTVAAAHQKDTECGKELTGTSSCRSGKVKREIPEDACTVLASDTRALSAKSNGTRTVSVVAESLSQRPVGCRSRRASRDLDQSSNSYASQILEDIQNYHEQQHQDTSTGAAAATPSFTLPACVAKACSILEAVADLNSSSSDNRTYDYDDRGSVNALSGTDNRVEPSVRRQVPAVRDLRAETGPGESAGSNSVSSIPWTPSWEPTSRESTERTWSTNDDVVDQAGSHGAPSPMNKPRQSKQRPSQPEPSGRSRTGSGNGNSLQRGRSAHRGSGSMASARSGVRAVSATS